MLSYVRSVSCLCMFIQLLGPRASLEHPALGCDWFNWKSCGTTGHRPIIYLEFIRHNIMIYYDLISNLAVVCISIPVMVGWPCRRFPDDHLKSPGSVAHHGPQLSWQPGGGCQGLCTDLEARARVCWVMQAEGHPGGEMRWNEHWPKPLDGDSMGLYPLVN